MKKPDTAMNNEGCEIWSALQASGEGWMLEAEGQWTAKPDYLESYSTGTGPVNVIQTT